MLLDPKTGKLNEKNKHEMEDVQRNSGRWQLNSEKKLNRNTPSVTTSIIPIGHSYDTRLFVFNKIFDFICTKSRLIPILMQINRATY